MDIKEMRLVLIIGMVGGVLLSTVMYSDPRAPLSTVFVCIIITLVWDSVMPIKLLVFRENPRKKKEKNHGEK